MGRRPSVVIMQVSQVRDIGGSDHVFLRRRRLHWTQLTRTTIHGPVPHIRDGVNISDMWYYVCNKIMNIGLSALCVCKHLNFHLC